MITNDNESNPAENTVPESNLPADNFSTDYPESNPVKQRNSTINPRYTFDNFVVDANNRQRSLSVLYVSSEEFTRPLNWRPFWLNNIKWHLSSRHNLASKNVVQV